MFVATLYARSPNVTMPPEAVTLVVPCNVPLPALRVARTMVLLSLLRKLPNWSSIRRAGCCANATPATAVLEGWESMTSRLAPAGRTLIEDEVEVENEDEKSIVIVSATL